MAPNHHYSFIHGVAHLEAHIVIVLREKTPNNLEELSHLKKQGEEIFAVLSWRAKLQAELFSVVHETVSIVFVQPEVSREQLGYSSHDGGDLVFLPGYCVNQLFLGVKWFVV